MLAGVIIEDPQTTYIDEKVSIKAGTTILPNTRITGDTQIGTGCVIGPNTIITNCKIGDDNEVLASVLTDAIVANNVHIGPFAYLRPKSIISDNVKIGDFVEIKNATIGDGTKVSHLTYIGDCDVGKKVNFGCGCVVVNYDGTNKHRSKVGDNAFIGCNTNLVSPVEIGESGYTAAGSTITKNVPDGSLAIARAKQEIKEGWVERKGYLKK
jgi:bifunctional UDP-N-acetylglucosamine pyrophosphorylase/glucosamine-1-phosphate N-acetyltransferase